MPKTKEDSVFVLNLVDEFRDIFFHLYLFKHSDDCFISSTVLGTVESPCCHRDSSVEIHSRTGDMPYK